MDLREQVTGQANALWYARTLGEWRRSLPGSAHTVRAYTRNLEQFCQWLDGVGLDLLTVERSHLDRYHRASSGAPATIAQKLAAISSFYRFSTSIGLTATNPVDLVRRPRIPADPATQALTVRQARALLDAARTDSPRSHALVSLLLFTGIRVGEAVAADTTDYGDDAGQRMLTVPRRGGVRAKVVLADPAADALDAYLGIAGQHRKGPGTGFPIFTTATGRRWASSEVFRTVQRLALAAHIEGRIGPHSLRRTFATIAPGTALHDLQDDGTEKPPGSRGSQGFRP